MKTIKLINFWQNLISRWLAKEVFSEAQKESFEIIFDCSWIEFISSSFADELFAKWKNQFWRKFKIINLDNQPLLVEIIKQSFITRDKFISV